MKNIVTRSLSGAAFVIILVSGIMFSSFSFIALMMLLTGMMMYEFYSIIKVRLNRPNVPLGILLGLLVYLLSVVYAIGVAPPELISVIIPVVVLIFVHEIYRLQKNPLANVGLTFLGVVYIALPLSLLNFLAFDSIVNMNVLESTEKDYMNNVASYFLVLKPSTEITYVPYLILGFFLIIWMYDTAAYLFGISLGKHPLFRSVSPKKSWEGFIGGLAVTPGTAYILFKFIGLLTYTQWLVFAFIIVIFSTFGDLTESLFKRSINLKDSGKIIPGHGGLLDRFDSVLLAAPMAYLYIEFCI